MTGGRTSLGLLRPRLLAALLVCLAPASASAQDLVFRNECRYSVTVQAVTVQGGVVRRSRPYTLRHLESTPPIRMPGNKLILVSDPRVPNRILCRGTVREGTTDFSVNIVQDRRTGQVTMLKRAGPPPRGGGGGGPPPRP